jgi:hypothetical protein
MNNSNFYESVANFSLVKLVILEKPPILESINEGEWPEWFWKSFVGAMLSIVFVLFVFLFYWQNEIQHGRWASRVIERNEQDI